LRSILADPEDEVAARTLVEQATEDSEMRAQELARKMVKVSKQEGGWSVMVANRSREGEATRFSFVDYRERKEALGIARLIRRAIVDAFEESKKAVGARWTEGREDGS
jgi:hypothetical protein